MTRTALAVVLRSRDVSGWKEGRAHDVSENFQVSRDRVHGSPKSAPAEKKHFSICSGRKNGDAKTRTLVRGKASDGVRGLPLGPREAAALDGRVEGRGGTDEVDGDLRGTAEKAVDDRRGVAARAACGRMSEKLDTEDLREEKNADKV